MILAKYTIREVYQSSSIKRFPTNCPMQDISQSVGYRVTLSVYFLTRMSTTQNGNQERATDCCECRNPGTKLLEWCGNDH